MAHSNKVVWSEGLFLRPQHLQQQERYMERYIDLRTASLQGNGWGFTELELETDLLSVGKLGVRRARGVFPDGTPFAMPGDDPLPPALELDINARDQTIYLTLPLRQATQADIGRPESPRDQLFRYRVRELEAFDSSGSVDEQVLMEVGGLNTRLALESQPLEGLARIPLAQLVEVRSDRRVQLDDGFVPTVMACDAAPRLATFLVELLGLLHQRGEALAARVAVSDRGGAAEIADFLMLQLINRWQPRLSHWAAVPRLHPESLYAELLGLAGELATFTAAGKRPVPFPPYQHDAQRVAFEPVMAALRGSLSAVLEQTALSIPVQERKFGVWVAVIPDQGLLDNAQFVLAVKADLPGEEIRRRVPGMAKIGPVEQIRDLVNLQLPGIALAAMAVAPRQIPYHAGHVYFEFDKQSPMWRALQGSGGMAFHLGTEFPGTALQLWAIRG